MGGKKKQKSTVTVTTPPPTPEETLAQKKASAASEIGMQEAGYNWDEAAGQWVKRAPTPEETAQAQRDKEIEDLIYKKLTGQISPEDKALIEQSYGAAKEVGKSDLSAEFQRALDEINIGEGRIYEDIHQAATQGAAERGLGTRDTPIVGEREKLLRRSGEIIARNKQLLGEDFGRNLRNFETSMEGAKAGATLDVGQRQQLFAQALREFQAGLQQQAVMNRQMIGETFANQAFGLGNLRSRNITQTTKGFTGGGGGASSIMGGVGGLFQGMGSLFGSFGGNP